MKLRNKKTGEIVIADITHIVSGVRFDCGQSLAELNKEWEDYEEPKSVNEIDVILEATREYCNEHLCCSKDWEKIKILNSVEEKLKAYKRLKDKGFSFEGWEMDGTIWFETKQDEQEWSLKYREDLDLLFGGEE